jgi:hypothetical protein
MEGSARVKSKKTKIQTCTGSASRQIPLTRLECSSLALVRNPNLSLRYNKESGYVDVLVNNKSVGTAIDPEMIKTVAYAPSDKACNMMRLRGPITQEGTWFFDLEFLDYTARKAFLLLLASVVLRVPRYIRETS